MCKIHSEIPYTDSYSIAHFYGSERETEGLCSVISNPLQPFGWVAHHASLSIRFLKQEYSDSGIKTTSSVAPALPADSLTAEP